MPFAIKAPIPDPTAPSLVFPAQKTMYGGKHVAQGDTAYLFDSETQGGRGLVGRGIVTSVVRLAPEPGLSRQTPRVSVVVRPAAPAIRPLGRRELKPLTGWADGQPGSELNFKLYRQATNKLIGISDEAAAFLDAFCGP